MVDCKVVSLIAACMLILTRQCSHCAEIIGGREVKPHSMPYMALLGRVNFKPSCGGILISPQCILTAAHCNEIATAWLGVHDQTKEEKSKQIREVQLSIPHEGYDETTMVNDLMLIKLHRPVSQNKEVKFLRLSGTVKEPPAKSTCLAAGWGWTSNTDEQISNVLMSINMTVIDRGACNKTYRGQVAITRSMICAKSLRGEEAGTCKGDSGGPLLCKDKLVGVTSFGPMPCGQKDIPGVYTFLSRNHLQWIEKKMKQHACKLL